MPTQLKIDLRNLPADGLDIEGTLPTSFFGLEPQDNIRAISSPTYALNLIRDDGKLVITGELCADFSLDCGRCAEPFDYRMEILDYETELPIEGEGSIIDLTEAIRDDILVALPPYPRCEDGNIEPRECPAIGRFESVPAALPDEPAKSDPAVWNVLDQLKNR
jgi:uncharacterized metal-binding protein YceD (DUF177 family)